LLVRLFARAHCGHDSCCWSPLMNAHTVVARRRSIMTLSLQQISSATSSMILICTWTTACQSFLVRSKVEVEMRQTNTHKQKSKQQSQNTKLWKSSIKLGWKLIPFVKNATQVVFPHYKETFILCTIKRSIWGHFGSRGTPITWQ
jgi:hypothetical protein